MMEETEAARPRWECCQRFLAGDASDEERYSLFSSVRLCRYDAKSNSILLAATRAEMEAIEEKHCELLKQGIDRYFPCARLYYCVKEQDNKFVNG